MIDSQSMKSLLTASWGGGLLVADYLQAQGW